MLLHQGLMEFHTKFIKRIPDYVSFFFKFWNVRSQRVKHHCNGKMQRKLIPKSKAPSKNSISDFLPIALLNTEGKLFFSLISKRLESHQSNKIMNLSGYCKHLSISLVCIEKGQVSEIFSCINLVRYCKRVWVNTPWINIFCPSEIWNSQQMDANSWIILCMNL